MKPLALLSVFAGLLMYVPASNGDDACRYIKSRKGLSGYETGGHILSTTSTSQKGERTFVSSYGRTGMTTKRELPRRE